MSQTPENDPSIFAEPQFQNGPFKPDESESKAGYKLRCEKWELDRNPAGQLHEQVEHGIGDEPALRAAILPAEPGQIYTWRELYVTRWGTTSATDSFLTILMIIVLAGPAAVAGAFFSGLFSSVGWTVTQMAYVMVIGPLTEELLKTMLLITLLETKPWLVRSRFQILIAAFSGALLFGVIENLIYLNIYIPNPTEGLIYWRWLVCTSIHVVCTMIASLGLCKMWEFTRKYYEKADVALAYPWLLTAFFVHAGYNTLAVVLDITGFKF